MYTKFAALSFVKASRVMFDLSWDDKGQRKIPISKKPPLNRLDYTGTASDKLPGFQDKVEVDLLKVAQ